MTPEEIIKKAFEFCGLHSLADMSVPALARYMGAPVTSIYWHFRAKEDLLDTMVVSAFEKFYSEIPEYHGDDWREGLRSFFTAFRQELLDDPVIADLVINRPMPHSPSQRELVRAMVGEHIERELDRLVSAGFTVEIAWRTYAFLSIYARGSVRNVRLSQEIEEQRPNGTRSGLHRDSEAEWDLWTRDAERFPNIAAARPWTSPTMATDKDFEFALDTVISALEQRLASAGPAGSPVKRGRRKAPAG